MSSLLWFAGYCGHSTLYFKEVMSSVNSTMSIHKNNMNLKHERHTSLTLGEEVTCRSVLLM